MSSYSPIVYTQDNTVTHTVMLQPYLGRDDEWPGDVTAYAGHGPAILSSPADSLAMTEYCLVQSIQAAPQAGILLVSISTSLHINKVEVFKLIRLYVIANYTSKQMD